MAPLLVRKELPGKLFRTFHVNFYCRKKAEDADKKKKKNLKKKKRAQRDLRDSQRDSQGLQPRGRLWNHHCLPVMSHLRQKTAANGPFPEELRSTNQHRFRTATYVKVVPGPSQLSKMAAQSQGHRRSVNKLKSWQNVAYSSRNVIFGR